MQMLIRKTQCEIQLSETSVIQETISNLAQHIMATADLSRADRLWPADSIVFQTNPLNLAYGACGTALFLHEALGELPDSARNWLLAQPITHSEYPPGLYSGIAGIAWCFAEMKMFDRALELMAMAPASNLAFAAADIFNGTAGWGLASLALYLMTGQDDLLQLACRAGDHLVRTAERDPNGAFWRDADDEDENLIRLGFAHGGSGIALFLLYLWQVTDDLRYRRLAQEALEFEIAQGKKQGDSLVWGVTTQDEGNRPYWLRGGGGVATTLIRFATALKDDRYLDLAHSAARGCAAFFSVAPHLFEGLASMGESLLDMFLATGEPWYLQAAQQKAAQILLFRIYRSEGTAFPGRYLMRISHDYGVGGAGIGLFLHRLAGLKPRKFHDIFALRSQSSSGPGLKGQLVGSNL